MTAMSCRARSGGSSRTSSKTSGGSRVALLTSRVRSKLSLIETMSPGVYSLCPASGRSVRAPYWPCRPRASVQEGARSCRLARFGAPTVLDRRQIDIDGDQQEGKRLCSAPPDSWRKVVRDTPRSYQEPARPLARSAAKAHARQQSRCGPGEQNRPDRLGDPQSSGGSLRTGRSCLCLRAAPNRLRGSRSDDETVDRRAVSPTEKPGFLPEVS